MKKAVVITIILLGLLGGAAVAVGPLLFRTPVIGENVVMQVVAPPTEASPLKWSLSTNPSFPIPQEGETVLLSPSQEIVSGRLQIENTSPKKIYIDFWGEAISVYGDASDAPTFRTVLIGTNIEHRSGPEGLGNFVLQSGEKAVFTLQIFAEAEESAPFRGVSFTIRPLNHPSN